MLSLAYAGPACCEGEYDVLINLYFGEASANLFDWAMTHVEAHLPFTDRLALAFVWRVTDSGTESLSFGVDFEW